MGKTASSESLECCWRGARAENLIGRRQMIREELLRPLRAAACDAVAAAAGDAVCAARSVCVLISEK
jgi:L-aminopeptidase/D-esterase-like protein